MDDTCNNGVCRGSSNICDDNNECTFDYCENGTCFHDGISGNSCEDGISCTVNDMCDNGLCVSGNVNCNDDNACTFDYCEATGCVFYPLTGESCDDNSSCTVNDTCANGVCGGILICECKTDLDCDDQNQCTWDRCHEGVCFFENKAENTSCSDGLFCNGLDACSNGTCSPLGMPPCPCIESCNEEINTCNAGPCRSEVNEVGPLSNSVQNVTLIASVSVSICIFITLVTIAIILVLLKKRRSNKKHNESELSTLTPNASLIEIKSGEIKVLNLLGSGNFGSVYKGDWLGTIVALKTQKEMSSDWIREITIISKLTHTHILRFLGKYEDEGTIYIVTE